MVFWDPKGGGELVYNMKAVRLVGWQPQWKLIFTTVLQSYMTKMTYGCSVWFLFFCFGSVWLTARFRRPRDS